MAGIKLKLNVATWRRSAVCVAVSLVLGAMSATASSDSIQPVASAAKAPATQPVEVLDPKISAEVANAVAGQTYQLSDIRGGAFANHPFEDYSRDGVLIGFRLGLGSFFNTQIIKYIQPIYLTPRGEERGKGFGDKSAVERTVEAKAPSGYAVGALRIAGGGGMGGMTITYMRFNGTRIDPTDIRTTPKIGGAEGRESLDGDGTPIIGIHGHQNDKGDCLGLGLVFIKPTAMVDHH